MTLDELYDQVRGLVVLHEAASHEAELAQLRADSLAQEQAVLTGADETFKALIETVQTESHQQVESLLTFGLQSVFDDLHMTAKLVTTEKRGAPWSEVEIVQRTVQASILEASGGGPASLIAFLLRVLTVRRTGLAPLLLLDEPFSMVSSAYVPKVAQLLRQLAEKTGLTILMVTHDRQYLDAATHGYEVVDNGPDGTTFKAVTA